MTEDTKRFVLTTLKAGAVGTLLSLPVLLAMRQYIPDDATVAGVRVKNPAMAVAFTAIGLGTELAYIRRDHPQVFDVATQRALAAGG